MLLNITYLIKKYAWLSMSSRKIFCKAPVSDDLKRKINFILIELSTKFVMYTLKTIVQILTANRSNKQGN